MKQKYKSLFLSDLHIGIEHCQVSKLNKFLKENEFENLFLVGDIIDMTNLKSKVYWNNESTKFIRRILKESKHKNVYYIIGNHDYFLEMFLGETLSNIKFSKEMKYTTVKGEEVLLIHGDKFDGMITNMRWLYWLGDRAYSFALFLNLWVNKTRSIFGKRYWSLSKYLKSKVKGAIQFVNNFEKLIVEDAKNNNVQVVIAGHIHVAEDKIIDGIRYMNCGDWVEQTTCIVEDLNGNLILMNIE
jgi:UDP-2,3-diacylglucosamine pyrophosphatase LpxH